MSTVGSYICAGNLLWARTADPLTAGVPLNPKQIQVLVDRYFTQPSAMPLAVKIAVSRNEDPMTKKGSLYRISPIEMLAAMLDAVASAIRASAGDAILQEWKTSV